MITVLPNLSLLLPSWESLWNPKLRVPQRAILMGWRHCFTCALSLLADYEAPLLFVNLGLQLSRTCNRLQCNCHSLASTPQPKIQDIAQGIIHG